VARIVTVDPTETLVSAQLSPESKVVLDLG
jgi:hypothetical protein